MKRAVRSLLLLDVFSCLIYNFWNMINPNAYGPFRHQFGHCECEIAATTANIQCLFGKFQIELQQFLGNLLTAEAREKMAPYKLHCVHMRRRDCCIKTDRLCASNKGLLQTSPSNHPYLSIYGFAVGIQKSLRSMLFITFSTNFEVMTPSFISWLIKLIWSGFSTGVRSVARPSNCLTCSFKTRNIVYLILQVAYYRRLLSSFL